MSVSAPAAIAPDPTLDFLGLFADQTEDVILARMMDWANEGLDPVRDADLWVDTREGGHWRTAIMPCVREIARLYDFAGTEVPMAAFVLWAWGTYLDDLAAAYNVDRKPAVPATGVVTFSGPAGTDVSLNTAAGTDPAAADDPAQLFQTTAAGTIPDAGGGSGQLDLPIVALDAGAAGDVAAGAITAPSTPLPAGVTVVNAAPTSGGADPESDEDLRIRVQEALIGQGGANVAAYVRWASAWPGVGSVKVIPAWAGPNTVLVVVGDKLGQPVSSTTVSGLQADLDPTPGQGSGTAPVGAEVTVATPTPLNVTIAAAGVSYKPGYSADGAGNTVAVQPLVEQAIRAYLLTIPPGGHVVLSHVAGIIATWEGVDDIGAVTLNGAGANVAVALSPPQVPTLISLAM